MKIFTIEAIVKGIAKFVGTSGQYTREERFLLSMCENENLFESYSRSALLSLISYSSNWFSCSEGFSATTVTPPARQIGRFSSA
jgi:hypothetical protein